MKWYAIKLQRTEKTVKDRMSVAPYIIYPLLGIRMQMP